MRKFVKNGTTTRPSSTLLEPPAAERDDVRERVADEQREHRGDAAAYRNER